MALVTFNNRDCGILINQVHSYDTVTFYYLIKQIPNKGLKWHVIMKWLSNNE